jgi:CheY-like chemotaxis protein
MSSGPHLVVVDDDPAILTLLAQTARAGLGARVTTFPSAEAALAAWPSLEEVALLLTDHSMAGLTGLELATRVRARAPALPIVMLSAVEVPLDAPGIVTRSLLKPCPPRVLLPVLRALLGLAEPPPAAPSAPRAPSRLEALTAKYVASLAEVPARLEVLAAAAGDEPGAKALRELLHQLAGTAGSYGFPDVTDAALALGVAVKGGQPLGAPLEALLRAVRAAAAR